MDFIKNVVVDMIIGEIAPKTKKSPTLRRFLKSGKRGSNSRHSAWEADALPTELLPHVG